MIPFLTICMDNEGVKLAFPNVGYKKEIWEKYYTDIAQAMIEIGTLIAERKYPPILIEGKVRHKIPKNDIIVHSASTKCKCAPKYFADKNLVYHYAMDGSNSDPKNENDWITIDAEE